MPSWYKDLRAGVIEKSTSSVAPALPDAGVAEEAAKIREETEERAANDLAITKERMKQAEEEAKERWRRERVLRDEMSLQRTWDSIVSLFWWAVIIGTLLFGYWAAPKAIEYGHSLAQESPTGHTDSILYSSAIQGIPGVGITPMQLITMGVGIIALMMVLGIMLH